MARSFTKQEKETIKGNLLEACRRSWTQYGYKKTSVDELCGQAGISKGAFYLFFESKEALFCEVLCAVQEQIYTAACQIMEERKDKYGAAEALKYIYREYDQNNFLYDSNRTDFVVLKNKLSKEQAGKLEELEQRNQEIFFSRPYLNCKVDTGLAISVIYSLIMNIKNKDILPYNHKETFDFMADRLMEHLFI